MLYIYVLLTNFCNLIVSNSVFSIGVTFQTLALTMFFALITSTKRLLLWKIDIKSQVYIVLKLIICYISSGATNIAEVSSGFHQADWSTTLGIFYCYHCSFLFWYICLLVYRNLILTISAQMKTSAQFKFVLYITND